MTKSEAAYLRYYFQNEPDILLFTALMYEHVHRTKFIVNWHHRDIANKLNEIVRGTHPTNHVMFNIPPRHTKTELAIINFCTYGFGINPNSEFMHLSASDDLVRRNISMMRGIMDSEYYKLIFPDVQLIDKGSEVIRTSAGGRLWSAPFLGQITGFGCGRMGSELFSGAMLIDDPMKSQDALSKKIREKVNFTWANTLVSRRNDVRTPVIVTAQRLEKNDFCGFLIEKEGTIEEGGKWDVVKFPAIIDEGTDHETALFPARIPIDELYKQRELDPWVFETQYQQNPKPIAGLLFDEKQTKLFNEIDQYDYIHCQIDPADGGDHCCSVIYGLRDRNVFVLDIIYTRENSDISLIDIYNQIEKYRPTTVRVESNMAWRLYYRMLKEKIAANIGTIDIYSFNSVGNKEARIYHHHTIIREKFHYLTKDKRTAQYNEAMRDRHDYMKMVENQDDDFVDVDTSACMYFIKNNFIDNI